MFIKIEISIGEGNSSPLGTISWFKYLLKSGLHENHECNNSLMFFTQLFYVLWRKLIMEDGIRKIKLCWKDHNLTDSFFEVKTLSKLLLGHCYLRNNNK